ncbi:hypothetical protein CDD83_1636 [Cordyceps sp. RAO-2017]|nr:hypothetical protein CDD83_1636 [Cordyceps sp. RAO-2017]
MGIHGSTHGRGLAIRPQPLSASPSVARGCAHDRPAAASLRRQALLPGPSLRRQALLSSKMRPRRPRAGPRLAVLLAPPAAAFPRPFVCLVAGREDEVGAEEEQRQDELAAAFDRARPMSRTPLLVLSLEAAGPRASSGSTAHPPLETVRCPALEPLERPAVGRRGRLLLNTY